MSFAPLLPATGVTGYKLLVATEARQREVFDRQPAIARDIAYFTENIGNVETPADLIADRKLLRVALGAFGLDDEINKGAFLRKILEEGSEDPEAFANRLVDPRYVNFTRAFGFGDIGGARTGLTSFPAEITDAYRERQFEIAVGDQNESLRLALNFRREIKTYATMADPENTAWLSLLGDRPTRAVIEGAFGLPQDFGQLDVDRQRAVLQEKNLRDFGSKSLDVFLDDANVELAITKYLARQSILEGPSPTTPGATALTLLSFSSFGLGQQGFQNLLNS